MRVLRPALKRLLRPAGYAPIPVTDFQSAVHSTNQYLPNLLILDLVQRFELDCFIDVGANEGQTATGLRDSGYNGRIVSFEPGQEAFDVMAQLSASDPLWRVDRLAIGSRDGEARLHVTERSYQSSLLTPEQGVPVQRDESVPLRRLDGMALEGSRFFLKSDTQGSDLEVLKGAEGLLDRVIAVQVEVSVIPQYVDTPDWLDVSAWMQERGFDPVAFFPMVRSAERAATIEFDAVFVRERQPDAGIRNGVACVK